METDGIAFDPDSIQAERITEGADYDGIRIRFLGALSSARINMQIDIGFGNIVFPEPKELVLPTMLNFSAPRLLCNSRESPIDLLMQSSRILPIMPFQKTRGVGRVDEREASP